MTRTAIITRFGVIIPAGLVVLWVLSQVNYLLFHAVVEGFSVVVAGSLFIVAWNSRRISGENSLLFLGIAYAHVGALDFLHMLAYQGMGVFPAAQEADLATQLWIAARYLETLSLLVFPLLIRRRVTVTPVFAVYAAVTALLLASILGWRIFPACYDPASGLTRFKNVSEYVISALLVAAILLLSRRRAALPRGVFGMLMAALVVTVASEFMFTLYATPISGANFLGHVLKVVSFYLIYRAMISTTLMKPYELLFRDLSAHREWLETEKRKLEHALAEIRTLRGILPICAECKKVRDDQGYWKQVEDYIVQHSDARFSHGLCPECYRATCAAQGLPAEGLEQPPA